MNGLSRDGGGGSFKASFGNFAITRGKARQARLSQGRKVLKTRGFYSRNRVPVMVTNPALPRILGHRAGDADCEPWLPP
jgi:hypothetical protein